ncbi:peptide synthetase [Xaviernesmea oryzae]|uniref:Peptide synthetase n=1 Tax=Xaviernesmea oryzae TaxID=464029 RepID=A0A1Q9AYW6_9HYPH|nr:amino acid synthesis family protein [Xaviernesmea oryzae]OLP60893.1 peptide synthetase [Xaviernesmea oryzae]SEL22568.1 Amino acid synthesis [Xaviernesmea oryzae]
MTEEDRGAAPAGLRRILTVVEETLIEGGQVLAKPTRRAASVAVIANPFSGIYEEDLAPLMETGKALGRLLPERAVAALEMEGCAIESFGKAALVGEDGELEHAAALLHPDLGAPFRDVLGGGAALIPSSKKRGAPGAPFDIPLGHKDAARVRSHFDGMEVRVPDGPRADEIAVAIAVTDSGRPLPRVGGLTKDRIIGKNGVI